MRLKHKQILALHEGLTQLSKEKLSGKFLYNLARSLKLAEQANDIAVAAKDAALKQLNLDSPTPGQFKFKDNEQLESFKATVDQIYDQEFEGDFWPLPWAELEKLSITPETLAGVLPLLTGEPTAP